MSRRFSFNTELYVILLATLRPPEQRLIQLRNYVWMLRALMR